MEVEVVGNATFKDSGRYAVIAVINVQHFTGEGVARATVEDAVGVPCSASLDGRSVGPTDGVSGPPTFGWAEFLDSLLHEISGGLVRRPASPPD